MWVLWLVSAIQTYNETDTKMTAATPSTRSTLAETFARPAATQVKKELRVLQIFTVLSVGGAETWLISLLRYFREYEDELPVKVKLDVLLTGGTKAVFDEEAMELGARLFYVPFTRRNIFGFTREVRRILRDGNYDAVHDHQDYIAGLHFLMGAGHLPRVRVAHVHNPFFQRNSQTNGLVRRLANSLGKRLVGRFASHVMGTSRQIVSEYGFDGVSSGSIVLGAAHCGFDVTRYRGNPAEAHRDVCREFFWDESAKIVLFVGRLESKEVLHHGKLLTHKNPVFALDVARACIAKDQSVRFLMVGSGEIGKKELGARVKEWGLDQKIRFTGVRHDVPRLMLASDLLLLPSLAEGLGMVVVEAQAAGLPVLASDSIPRECVVIPGMVTFWSLDANASSWASEVKRLINLDHPDCERSNTAIRNSAFSIENSAALLLSIYGHSQLEPV